MTVWTLDYIIKVSCDCMDFKTLDFGRGDIMILVCHLIFQNHVIKVSHDFMDKSQSQSVAILSSMVAIDTLVVRK